ncbi:MAG: ABC transporter ATP-binding protein [Thermoprotei archaeon]|nr:ABC transporter ATP-binding protein [Thermoprotei archaeon]
MANYILEVKNLKKYFPITAGIFNRIVGWVKAVDDVSFSVERNTTYAIVGESGCGKSTLARTIIGIYAPTSGSIIFEGTDITKLSRKEKLRVLRKMSIVFQDPTSSLNPRHKVIDIITAPLKVHKIGSSRERKEKAKELIKVVELDETFLNKYPHELSGGQRQRVAIARALALEPELIILDEPTSALDVSVQAKILNLLKHLQKKLKLTYILITHNLGVVRNFADHVSVMYAGKIVETAPIDKIFSEPKHPYTRALIDAIPPVTPEEEELIKKLGLKIKPGDPPSLSNPPSGCRFHPRCPFATEKCRKEEPKPVVISENHVVYCHLFS